MEEHTPQNQTLGKQISEPQRSELTLDEKLRPMRDEPPTVASSEPQEWTPEHVAVLLNGGGGISDVAAAINAALAAEREQLADADLHFDEVIQQLAAEGEKRKPLVEALEVLLDQVDWMAGNCRVNEMVGAVLEKSVIEKGRAALAEAKEAK